MSKSKSFTFLLIFLSLSAILCFYNFDSASAYTGTITYDSGTNTITCVGGSSGTPITFNDIYEADLAEGWNKFFASGEIIYPSHGFKGYSFYYANNVSIQIGNSIDLTYFRDFDKEILINLPANGIFFIGTNNSFIEFGYLIDENNKISNNGLIFKAISNGEIYSYMIFDEGCEVNIYSSVFGTNNRLDWIGWNKFFISGFVNRIWNCKFFDVELYYLKNTDLYNIDLEYYFTSSNGLTKPANCTIKNVYISFSVGVIGGDYFEDVFIYNLIGKNNTFINSPSNIGNKNYFFIDCVFDKWVFRYPYENMEGKHYRQYTFNLNVLNGEITDFVQNANVTLYKDNVKIYSGLTNSSGMIPTQTLTYGYYQQATGDTIQNATSPYYLVISHPDWQTYISRFYITEPLRLTVSMQEPTYTGYTEAEKSDYTTIILFVISLILCIIGLALTVPLLPLIALTVSVINVLLLTEISMFNILLIILNIIFTVITIVRTKTKNN